MKIIRKMAETYIQKEIESLGELLEAMESGLIESSIEEFALLEQKRDGLKNLHDINLKLALAEAGVPREIMMSKREKKVFFKLLSFYMKWTSFKRIFS